MKLLVVLLAIVATVSPAPQDIVFGSLTPDGTIPSSNDSPVDVWKHFKVSSHKNGQTNGHPVEEEILSGPNPYEHFGLVSSNILNRHRRGLLEWIKKSITRYNRNTKAQPNISSENSANKISSGDDDQTVEFSKLKPQSSPLPVTAGESRGDISYTGDTDVNYLGAVQPRDNPDAEVFDINLVREDANRFFARRPQPNRAQPMMSQPIRSQPMRSQPIRSQPMMFQPTRAQPMMSQPIRSHRTFQG